MCVCLGVIWALLLPSLYFHVCTVPCDVNFIIWECVNRIWLLDHIPHIFFCACMYMWNASYRSLIKVQNRLVIGWMNIAGRLHSPHVQMHDKAAPYTLWWWNLCRTQLQMCKNLRGGGGISNLSVVSHLSAHGSIWANLITFWNLLFFFLFMLTAVCRTEVLPLHLKMYIGSLLAVIMIVKWVKKGSTDFEQISTLV